MLNLSKRLKTVCDMVPECEVIADIGCDHAFVSIQLIESQKANRAIACDVNEGPLVHAKDNILKADLEEYIELRLSDGLNALKENEADCIIIAGMGGRLMLDILLRGNDRIGDKTVLILGPQSDVGEFRRFLSDNGYMITEERMVFEDGKYYPLIKAQKGKCDYITREDFEYGKFLLDSKSQELKAFLLRERENLNKILSKIGEGKNLSLKNEERIKELEVMLTTNENALQRFE